MQSHLKLGQSLRINRSNDIRVRARPTPCQYAAFHVSITRRSRLSETWIPTGGIASDSTDVEDSLALLIRAGYIRQGHAGLFHFLPLALRVQDKLEGLICRHMYKLGASKVALSSISSESLWRRSGRLKDGSGELFRFRDRKDISYLLAPTHEEEITAIAANAIKSYKDLPLRLFQISRKYRDELRPRQGLLRAREFSMKDLYTFDMDEHEAVQTYNAVVEAYMELFKEFKVPYIVAKADSGNMGGSLSHEFHLPTTLGEDDVVSCSSCDYSANDEVAEGRLPQYRDQSIGSGTAASDNSSVGGMENKLTTSDEVITGESDAMVTKIATWSAVTRDKLGLLNVHYPSYLAKAAGEGMSQKRSDTINVHRIKKLVPSLDTSIENPIEVWQHCFKPLDKSSPDGQTPSSYVINVYDYRLPSDLHASTFANQADIPLPAGPSEYFSKGIPTTNISRDPDTRSPIDAIRVKDGDRCPRCDDGQLKVRKAIELGHTFFLGDRYSKPLQAKTHMPEQSSRSSSQEGRKDISEQQFLQMGCYGIGVTRMIGAFASILADRQGLNWPRVMAPFEVAVVSGKKELDEVATTIYKSLGTQTSLDGESDSIDVALDDRSKPFIWKLKDMELIGIPVVVVVGRSWTAKRSCEVQCRRLNIKSDIPLDQLRGYVQGLLSQL